MGAKNWRRYTRICIQIDLDRPLKISIKIDQLLQPLLYEGLNFCSVCGLLGHDEGKCISFSSKDAELSRSNALPPPQHHHLTPKEKIFPILGRKPSQSNSNGPKSICSFNSKFKSTSPTENDLSSLTHFCHHSIPTVTQNCLSSTATLASPLSTLSNSNSQGPSSKSNSQPQVSPAPKPSPLACTLCQNRHISPEPKKEPLSPPSQRPAKYTVCHLKIPSRLPSHLHQIKTKPHTKPLTYFQPPS